MITPRRQFLSARLRWLHDSEAAPGIVLLIAAAAAMIAANTALEPAYHALLHHPLAWNPVARLTTLHLWINDGLMAVFFFVVGLEIKREVLGGVLANPATRRMPVIAAAAGMAAPAAIYLLIAGNVSGLARGWAIPAATDIAFAMGVVALLGSRVPPSLRLFLLTVAIVDDLGAVAIIALAYTTGIDLAWLGAAGAILGAMLLLARLRIEPAAPFVVLGVALWLAVLHSGVHATVAGVLAAFAIPLRPGRRHHDSLLLRMEHHLVPWNGFVVVPLFGFANAGVVLGGASLLAPLPLGIALGLVLGKQAGIFASLALAERLGIARRPQAAGWLQLWGIALLCGIGFTMSLFIAALAFPADPALIEEAKLGVFAGSLVSALLGYAVLRFARPAPP
ncbi:Na+/H+ antiporter NhaA [Novosphingobium sp. Gsoil 351]|uniref:Na+/H+ antiporter NhaA n=1 Tax=Novosphingobium sp. Gsoil 351 TaxID=2675225 RepID=UPI0012B4EEC5|nr:Na+/H+ antiporter NhaA [Novosphingobium sp. Gsoil 351]QGN55174.1 Na+/H+ antiporter NhaA [Novosphingobium sp. Gsoil 351]